MRKRVIERILLLGLVCLVIAACSSGGSEPEPVPVPTSKPTSTDAVNTDDGKTPETPAAKVIPARYRVARMDITVDGNMDVTSKGKEDYRFADYRETVLGTDPARHVSDYTYTSSFFTDMWKSKQFVSEVKVRWNRMRPRIMAEFWPRTKAYAEAAAGAMDRDARRWPIDRQPKTEINRMEKWLNSRTVFMDNIVTNYPNGN